MRYTITAHAADCYEVAVTYPDGVRITLGLYSSRASATAELRLIREAA